MQHDTTDDGRTDRRTHLKALGAGALATDMAGVAGCLGASTGSGGNGGTGEAESSSLNCEDLRAEFTAYDAAGTPLVFEFDYPQDGEVEKSAALRLGKSVNPETTLPTATFEMFQRGIPVGNPERLIDGWRTDEDFEEITTLDFAGESVPVIGGWQYVNLTYEYFAALPYDTSGGEREYYLLSFQVGRGGDTDAFEVCQDIALALSKKVVQSLRPNPDSTTESVTTTAK